MHHSSLLLGASLLALAACQPAEDAAEALEAETPPAVTETVVADVPEETADPVVEVATEAVEDDVETAIAEDDE
ncbi:MAG: hypothetical protein AAFY82_06875, partial [Pseudomonadota bacterium]